MRFTRRADGSERAAVRVTFEVRRSTVSSALALYIYWSDEDPGTIGKRDLGRIVRRYLRDYGSAADAATPLEDIPGTIVTAAEERVAELYGE